MCGRSSHRLILISQEVKNQQAIKTKLFSEYMNFSRINSMSIPANESIG
jgi:hypothetical protein